MVDFVPDFTVHEGASKRDLFVMLLLQFETAGLMKLLMTNI
jgi:hypothetical protein